MIVPIVLSGGSGTRLWPVSRTKMPKQFCSIFEQSLQEMTLGRLAKLSTPWIVTNVSLQELTLRQVQGMSLSPNQIVLEPRAKNTAPAIALMCQILKAASQEEAIVGVFPSDHLIENENKFFAALYLAEEEARNGQVVTLGIHPSSPATGYGYIQTDAQPSSRQGEFSAFPVKRFHEKPDLKTAESFLAAGNFYWNAGIFVFKVSAMIQALEKHQPQLWTIVSGLKADRSNMEEIFDRVDNISIDYAVLEKLSAKELTCIPCDIGWNDIGSWDAIAEILRETRQSIVEAQGSGNFVHGLPGRTYAFAGVEDLIVIDTPDALLVTRKGKTQTVKDVVDVLKLKNTAILREHPNS